MRASLVASVLFIVVELVSGCAGVRFVIDAVPASDELTETVVMEDEGGSDKSKVAMIDVTGMIIDAEKPGLIASHENPVARFTEAMHKAEQDSAVKAVVIRVNSPGGTVTASDLMFREIQHFKQHTGKPVVISMGDVAASGGYYVSCAGDEIIANPTTVTGSIGVIIETFNFSEGLQKIGVKSDAITSGPNKKMGSPFEPMPPEHRKLLQELVDEFYANFKATVVQNRPAISTSDLDWLTDGRVVTGKRAVEVGLVDKLGDLRDAFSAAKDLAKIKSARLVKYHRQLEYVGSPYAKSPMPAPTAVQQINLLQLNLDAGAMARSPGFYYLWEPSIN